MALIKSVQGKEPQFGQNCYLAENATVIGDLICEYIEKQVTGEGHVHHERLHKSTII